MSKNSQGVVHIGIIIVVLLAIGLIGYLVVQNSQLRRQTTQVIPPTPTTTSEDNVNETSAPVATPLALTQIPVLDTTDWNTVSLNGISFKIPPDASCSETTGVESCSTIRIPTGIVDQRTGDDIYSNIMLVIVDYEGGSRRQQFSDITSGDPELCNAVYRDSMFGTVKALEVAVKDCYNGGGIVSVIGDKLVIVVSHEYNSETNEIHRWDVKDTVISTLKAQ